MEFKYLNNIEKYIDYPTYSSSIVEENAVSRNWTLNYVLSRKRWRCRTIWDLTSWTSWSSPSTLFRQFRCFQVVLILDPSTSVFSFGNRKEGEKKKKEKKKRREKGCWSTVAPSFNLFLWCPEVNIFLDGSENVKSQTVGGNGNFFLPPFLLSVISFFLSLSFLPSILPSFHLPGHLTTYPGNTETLQLARNRIM